MSNNSGLESIIYKEIWIKIIKTDNPKKKKEQQTAALHKKKFMNSHEAYKKFFNIISHQDNEN